MYIRLDIHHIKNNIGCIWYTRLILGHCGKTGNPTKTGFWT